MVEHDKQVRWVGSEIVDWNGMYWDVVMHRC